MTMTMIMTMIMTITMTITMTDYNSDYDDMTMTTPPKTERGYAAYETACGCDTCDSQTLRL